MAIGVTAGCGIDPIDGSSGSDPSPIVPQLGSIHGAVVDGAGSSVGGGTVTTSPGGWSTDVAADGSFSINWVAPGSYSLIASADGYADGAGDSVTVTVEGDTEATATLGEALPAGGILTVHIDRPDGAPLVGAKVTASNGSEALTDEAGDATLTGVTGADLTLIAAADSDTWWPRTLTGLTVDESGGFQWSVQVSGRPPEGSKYVSSAICVLCHEEIGASIGGHRHSLALSTELSAELLARFTAGEELELDSGALVALSLAGSTPTVTLTDSGGAARSYEVAGLIGDPSQAGVPWTEGTTQAFPLPFALLAELPVRLGYPDAAARLVPYQLDRWFDSAGAFASSSEEPAAATSAEAQCFACHSTGSTLTPRSDGGFDMVGTKGSGRWNDAAVACERCHGPGERHVKTAASTPLETITLPSLLDPTAANEVCGQCHSRLNGDGTPYAWSEDHGFLQPGEALDEVASSVAEHWNSGAAKLSNEQVDEDRLSGHGIEAGAGLRCIDCHDSHASTLDDEGAPLTAALRVAPENNELCLDCHLSMSFEDSTDVAEAHTTHTAYNPDSITEVGRCTGCHMPGTAASVSYGDLSAAGDLASHLFTPWAPQETVDVFDALGASQLDPGEFPAHGCVECHAWNDWYFDDLGAVFHGPTGDPTLKATHEDFQTSYQGLWP